MTKISARMVVVVVLSAVMSTSGCVATQLPRLGGTPAPSGSTPISASPTASVSASPSPTPLTRQQVITASGPLTTRVEVTTCDGYGTGTGFLVGPNLVATVADVVDGAQTVAVRGAVVSSATVVGLDRDRQVALLQTSTPVSGGSRLSFATDEPQEGDEVIAITYPDGRPQTPIDATVNGVDRAVDVDGKRLVGLIQYNAGANAASGGGPVLDLAGEVVGLTEGRSGDTGEVGYAISTKTARGLIEAWSAALATIEVPDCPSKPDTVVRIDSKHPDAPGLGYFVRKQFDGLNLGDQKLTTGPDEGLTGYEAAFAVLSGPLKTELGPFERYRKNRLNAVNRRVVMSDVQKLDDVQDSVDIEFDRITRGAGSDKCVHAAYRYTARVASGTWTLDSRVPLETDQTPC